MKEKYGPWALIAGGSEGVGESFALQLAQSGINLFLVARRPEPLKRLADRLAAETGVEVRTVAQDLTDPDAARQVAEAASGLEIGMLVYNAGATASHGEFVAQPAEAGMRDIHLNVIGQASFVHRFGGPMRQRKRGGIILVGSMAGEAAAAGEIAYSASKSFTRVFAEGLWWELKPYGVDVLGLILGLTRTPHIEKLGLRMDNPDFPPAEPDAVVREGLAAIGSGPLHYAAGTGEFRQALATMPREQAIGLMSGGTAALFGGD